MILTLLILLVCLGLWAAWIEPRRLTRTEYTVPLPGLRQPLTVVAIGDLQPNDFHWPADRLASAFQKIAAEEDPDVVFWLGDYYNGHTDKTKQILDQNPKLKAWIDQRLPDIDAIAGAMTHLRGRLATIGILGNHDWAWSGPRTETALSAAGITMMRDGLTVVEADGAPVLEVLGYEDIASGRMPNFAALNAQRRAGMPAIALSHTPDAFPLDEAGPDLMISGHTHGGQVCMPYFGPILLPVEHPEYYWGMFAAFGRRLIVTRGVGTSLPPLRFLAPPEYVVLRLVPETDVEST